MEITKCPIFLDFLQRPIKPNNCEHIFCQVCLMMWAQKKSCWPLCRKKIDSVSQIYFPIQNKKQNKRLNHLYFSVENLKLDNYGKICLKCIVCGKQKPEDQLIVCNFCNYFQSHILCAPPLGLSYNKYYCLFCGKKFIESVKNK